MSDPDFLPGVPVNHVLDRLAKADGNEIGSGKFRAPRVRRRWLPTRLAGSSSVEISCRRFLVWTPVPP